MLASLLLILSTADLAHAVELTGQLRGQVVDPDGLSIPGATVTVESPGTLAPVTTTTDAEGYFRFPALPPGKYNVAISKDAMRPYRANDILVVTGQVVSLEAEMVVAVGGMEITVQADQPVVDTRKVSSGTVMSRETLRDIPNPGRDYQSATSYAAGVTGGGNPNVRGGFDDGNQYYVDGVNNTDPATGTFSMNMNFDAIEEVQVVTGGMDAEYGRSMGGAVNVVTRSGGNTFEGDVQFLTSGQWSQLYTPLEGEADPDDAPFSDNQLALNLGGPILKDKLWFFASLQGNISESIVSVDPSVGRPKDQPLAARDWRSAYWFGKLTWQPTNTQRLWLQAQGDPTHIANVVQDPYTLPEGEAVQTQGGWVTSAGHLWTPSPKTLVQTQLYYQTSHVNYFPISCDGADDIASCTRNLDDPWFTSSPDGFNGGDFAYGYLGNRNRVSANSSVTRFARLLGEHQAKAGLQYEYLTSSDEYPGYDHLVYKAYDPELGPTAIDAYTNDTLYLSPSEGNASVAGQLISGYIQDIWNPVPRLTIRPGVRADYGGFKNDTGILAFSSLTFAPRLGLAYDLTNDGRTNLHGYYGRFFDTGFLAVADLLHQRTAAYSAYGWDAEAGDWAEEPYYSIGGSNPVHTDLKNPYSDEFDLGISRDLGDGWAIDATFTYEIAHNFWEDDEVNLIWNAEGTDVIGYRSDEQADIYRIRTPDEVFTEYTSVETSIARQFGEKFGMLGSYTWSRAYGTNSAQYVTGVLDIPEQVQYETGLLGFDHTHVVKLAGSLRDPDGFGDVGPVGLGYIFGWNFEAASGTPYRGIYYNYYYQDWYNNQEALDGSYRLPMTSNTDIKLGLTVEVRESTFDLTLECFNLFNDRTVIDVDTTAGNETNDGPYLGDDGMPTFGTPLQRQSPRYLQLGFRGEF